MTKIDTLEFRISNYQGTAEEWISYKEKERVKSDIVSNLVIDKKVNKAIANAGEDGWAVKDIRIDNVVVQRHNNCGCDSVVSRYTIIYTK